MSDTSSDRATRLLPEEARMVRQASTGGMPATSWDELAVRRLRYMAPEVFKGLAPARSVDVYAFGCVAYWLLAGRQVFEAPTAMMLFYAHMNHRPDPLVAPARANVPEPLDRLVLRCLEKEPADRPAGFEEIEKELESTGLAAQWTAEEARAWWANQSSPEDRAAGDGRILTHYL